MPRETDAIRRFLAARGRAVAVSPIGAGEWSRAYRYETDAGPRVIRFGRHPEDFRKDEAAFARYGARVPIPRILEIGETGDGEHFAISEWADGAPLDGLEPAALRHALPSLLDVLDRLREAPPPTAEGAGLWSGSGVARHATWRDALLAIADDPEQPRLAGWRAELRQHPDAARTFDAAVERLRMVADACPDTVRSVVHADLTAGNVLVTDGTISAVIDWGNSLVGDFLYDVAWLVFWSPWHPGLDPDFVIAETRRRGREGGANLDAFEDRMHACQIQIALDSIAYTAFRRREGDLAATVDRLHTLLVARP